MTWLRMTAEGGCTVLLEAASSLGQNIQMLWERTEMITSAAGSLV